MKVSLKGLLLSAKRQLAILDKVVEQTQSIDSDNENSLFENPNAQSVQVLGKIIDIVEGTDFIECSIIFDELLGHIDELKKNPLLLEEFAKLYCLIK